jgi:hypothetical protein
MATTLAGPAGSAGALTWDNIHSVSAPFAGVSSKEFGFWFNYFWHEAAHLATLTQQQKNTLTTTYLTVFENKPGAPTPRADFAMKPAADKKKVLVTLLLIGFKRVVAPSAGPLDKLIPGEDAHPPMLAEKAKHLQFETFGNEKLKHWPIAYRADSRTYQEMVDAGGFLPRAVSQGQKVYADNGLDQPWHPYNDPAYGKCIWLRMGSTSKDNCLHTVISVGPKFADITHFPILNDATVFGTQSSMPGNTHRPLCITPLDLWNDQDIAAALNHRHKVIAVKDSSGVVNYLEKKNYVYVFHMRKVVGVNTQKAFAGTGDDFGERGMASIPAQNFLAYLPFTQRYWYSNTDNQIMLYEVKFDPIAWLPSEEATKSKIGGEGLVKLLSIINAEISKAESAKKDEKIKFEAFQKLPADRLTPGQRMRLIIALKEHYSKPLPAVAQVPPPRATPKPTPPAAGIAAPPGVPGGQPAGPGGRPGPPGPPPGGMKMAGPAKTIQQQTQEALAARNADKAAVKAILMTLGDKSSTALIAKVDGIDGATWKQIQEVAKL